MIWGAANKPMAILGLNVRRYHSADSFAVHSGGRIAGAWPQAAPGGGALTRQRDPGLPRGDGRDRGAYLGVAQGRAVSRADAAEQGGSGSFVCAGASGPGYGFIRAGTERLLRLSVQRRGYRRRMVRDDEIAALVALMRIGGRPWASYVVAARRASGPCAGLAKVVLDQELGLFADGAVNDAAAEVEGWQASGYRIVSILDADYPDNLRSIANRPPLLFVAGELRASDAYSVSVVGTRAPTDTGCRIAATVAERLSVTGYSVFSGLASGIDTCAHTAVLDRGGRTVAVIGTGLGHAYPPENARLQHRIANVGAVISQFWPEAGPTRHSFPMRNALMSGLTLGSVIVEASPASGTRVQARHALAQGRKLILMARVLAQDWAQELLEKPGVMVAETADDVVASLRR